MSLSDWIIDIALLLIVFRQLREARLTARTILLPLALIGWAASQYLHSVPTAGNDLVLIGSFTAVGVVFGLAGGLLTRVRYTAGQVRIKASLSAVALWVISMGFRLGFAVWSSHTSGATHLAHFSVAHDITSGQAWVTALILMAFGEVIVRLGTIVVRGQRITALARQEEQLSPVPAARPDTYV
ncbi:hypothetical protein POF50_000740 [Streptomyces sp. SL13]|uniref:DUF1453 domain-containing protein n=1 Tax=Streptantibioticus silvisoli TaxID=2705255 RepID=A0AA90H0G9_9ACTN|nr:hypothetical protein [Streptantibioticus silvisoli]MDI5962380.1 hypothetical protein [Streptantibioticus silvisoli]MDI5967892.1 hypothetical protein [Streptantibioticus silvisoli]